VAYHILEGVRIVDLTMVYAGPVATKIMVELGAEVIKIESIQRADVFTRANVYPDNEPGDDPWNRGSNFHALNAGKKGISLNMGDQRGREIFKRLVAVADAVIENYSPRVMDNWGLGYEELRKVKQDIVMVSLSGLGHTGPLRDSYMYVPGMEGMGGLTHLTGRPDAAPMLTGHAYGDWVAGANAAAALITALFYRQCTGRGQYVDVSGREGVACHLGDTIMDYTLNRHDPIRMGNDDPVAVPHGCYRCKGDDRWVNITVENDAQWVAMCRSAGHPEWIGDPRFANAHARRRSRKDLDLLIEAWTCNLENVDVMRRLQAVGVPAGAVSDMRDVSLDPHLDDRGFFYPIEHGPGVGLRPVPSQMPARFSGVESFVPERAPRFAEDDDYVLGTLLKMSPEEIQALASDKVVGGLPAFPRGRPTRTELIVQQGSGWFDPDYREELLRRYNPQRRTNLPY
jgi:crotonobetainyl-CoA:carnitine CoA-transferase CaiB-like acyl-CoA transferase